MHLQEDKNFAMWTNCSDNEPSRKAFHWLTKNEKEEGFGFGLITAIQSHADLPVDSTTHGTTKIKNNKNYGENLLLKSRIA